VDWHTQIARYSHVQFLTNEGYQMKQDGWKLLTKFNNVPQTIRMFPKRAIPSQRNHPALSIPLWFVRQMLSEIEGHSRCRKKYG